MLLFSRTAVIAPGKLREGLAFSVEIADYVTKKISTPVSVYNTAFGAPVGSIVWSTRNESHAELTDRMSTLMADEEYLDRITKAGSLFLPGMTDMLRQVVEAKDVGDEPAPFVQGVSAVLRAEHTGDGMEWSVAMTEYVHQATGLPSMFCSDLYGTFGQVTWLTGAPDAAAIDEADGKLAADSGYIERLQRAGELFVPGSGQRGLFNRIA